MEEFNYNLYEIDGKVLVTNKDWNEDKTLFYYNTVLSKGNEITEIKTVDPLAHVLLGVTSETIQDIVNYIVQDRENAFVVPEVLCSKFN